MGLLPCPLLRQGGSPAASSSPRPMSLSTASYSPISSTAKVWPCLCLHRPVPLHQAMLMDMAVLSSLEVFKKHVDMAVRDMV